MAAQGSEGFSSNENLLENTRYAAMKKINEVSSSDPYLSIGWTKHKLLTMSVENACLLGAGNTQTQPPSAQETVAGSKSGNTQTQPPSAQETVAGSKSGNTQTQPPSAQETVAGSKSGNTQTQPSLAQETVAGSKSGNTQTQPSLAQGDLASGGASLNLGTNNPLKESILFLSKGFIQKTLEGCKTNFPRHIDEGPGATPEAFKLVRDVLLSILDGMYPEKSDLDLGKRQGEFLKVFFKDIDFANFVRAVFYFAIQPDLEHFDNLIAAVDRFKPGQKESIIALKYVVKKFKRSGCGGRLKAHLQEIYLVLWDVLNNKPSSDDAIEAKAVSLCSLFYSEFYSEKNAPSNDQEQDLGDLIKQYRAAVEKVKASDSNFMIDQNRLIQDLVTRSVELAVCYFNQLCDPRPTTDRNIAWQYLKKVLDFAIAWRFEPKVLDELRFLRRSEPFQWTSVLDELRFLRRSEPFQWTSLIESGSIFSSQYDDHPVLGLVRECVRNYFDLSKIPNNVSCKAAVGAADTAGAQSVTVLAKAPKSDARDMFLVFSDLCFNSDNIPGFFDKHKSQQQDTPQVCHIRVRLEQRADFFRISCEAALYVIATHLHNFSCQLPDAYRLRISKEEGHCGRKFLIAGIAYYKNPGDENRLEFINAARQYAGKWSVLGSHYYHHQLALTIISAVDNSLLPGEPEEIKHFKGLLSCLCRAQSSQAQYDPDMPVDATVSDINKVAEQNKQIEQDAQEVAKLFDISAAGQAESNMASKQSDERDCYFKAAEACLGSSYLKKEQLDAFIRAAHRWAVKIESQPAGAVNAGSSMSYGDSSAAGDRSRQVLRKKYVGPLGSLLLQKPGFQEEEGNIFITDRDL